MRLPADAAVSFGPGRSIGPEGLTVGPAYYQGRRLRGEFLPGVAVRSDCRRFLVLSQFSPLRTSANLLLALPALALWVVAVGTDWWPWLRSEGAALLMGLAAVVVIACAVLGLRQLGARLRGRRLGTAPPFRLLLIDEDTGRAFRQRQGADLVVPRRMTAVMRIYYLPTLAETDDVRVVSANADNFRKLSRRQTYH